MYILCPYFNKTGENRGTFFKIQNRNYPKKLANKRLSSHDIRLMPFFQTQLLTNRGVQQGVQNCAELCRTVQTVQTVQTVHTVQNCAGERR